MFDFLLPASYYIFSKVIVVILNYERYDVSNKYYAKNISCEKIRLKGILKIV